jgi:hypothetical protein
VLAVFCSARGLRAFASRSFLLLLASTALLLSAFVAAKAPLAASPLAGLESKSEFAATVKTLAGASGKGISPRAAFEIAKIYEFCGVFWGPKSKADWMSLYRSTVKPDDPAYVIRMGVAERRYTQCEALLRQGDVYQARARWLALAVEQRDLAAQLMHRLEKPVEASSAAAFEAELRAALNSTDPVIVWELSRALRHASFLWGDFSSKSWPGKDVDGLRAVFQLTACEFGYPCGGGSTMIDALCIRGTCVAASYADWLPTFLEPAQLKLVRTEQKRVSKAMRSKRGAALFFK